MKRSNDRVTNMILNYLSNDLESIDEYIKKTKREQFIEFNDVQALNNLFNNVYDNISYQEVEFIRYYTGTVYREVNALLRNNWNYEINGQLTETKRIEYLKLSSDICNVINKISPLNSNIVTYRGVNLGSFRRYGITSLEELLKLKDEYYYEPAFTSTSLIREASFFDKELKGIDKCNIEIKYLIPQYSTDGIALLDNETTYAKNESEYLLNKASLSKIIDVSLSEDKTKAYITMLLIPKRIWDKEYERIPKTTYRK